MTALLKQIFNFLKLLNSDTGTNQLASGLSLGLILGFSPFISIQTFVVFAIIFIFRVQIGAAFLSAFLPQGKSWVKVDVERDDTTPGRVVEPHRAGVAGTGLRLGELRPLVHGAMPVNFTAARVL